MKISTLPGTFLGKIAAAAMVASLAGCGGGGEGGSGGGIGSGQSPDPVVVDLPILYVKRPLPVDDNGVRVEDDALDPMAFRPGAELIIRDRASPSAAERVLTGEIFADGELYDVKDLEPSFEGDKLLFAMRAPEIPNVDDDEQPTWNIWEYDLETDSLRRIITSDINARAGQDIAPQYLADGRIVFTSTRQRQARSILLDEGKPQYSGLSESQNQPAFVLHVMDNDGSNIQQISFNQSHDLNPTVLSTGEVLFSRWDRAANNNSISLYKINPDGRQLDFVYGYHSQDTGTNNSEGRFLQPREMPDGRILVSLRPAQTDTLGGDMVAVDITGYTEIDQSEMSNPAAPNTGTGQQSLAFSEVFTDDTPSPHGHFSSAFPLHDGSNRLLVSWAQCRLLDPADNTTIIPCTDANLALANVQEAQPLYGIWSYNLDDQSQQPIVSGEEDMMYTEVVAMQPRDLPVNIEDGLPGVDLDNDLLSEGVGVLHIRSVYDLDGTDASASGIAALSDPLQPDFATRDARFLRIVKAVPIPDDDIVDLDGNSRQMREVIGYTPIQPDGSVKVKIPANIPFMVSVLDANGRRISNQPIGGRHNNWLQLRPGEERECSGCHTATSELPHGRPNAEAPSINDGALMTGVSFPNTTSTLFPDAGETMAETLSRINGVDELSVDITFSDLWSDPLISTPDTDIQYQYSDLTTPHPTSLACQTDWSSNCRIVINYPTHIQPLWEADRQIFAADGITLLQDNTCTSCHSDVDAGNLAMPPMGQLNLKRGVFPIVEADPFTSYEELLNSDFEEELVLVDEDNDIFELQNVMIQDTDANGNPLFRLNPDGTQQLDIDGNPIPIMVPVTVPASMSTAGALASPRFFSRFNNGGSHAGYLNEAELKLLSEWLDIGGQYYNNPFDVPQN